MAVFRSGVDAFRNFMDEGDKPSTGGRARYARNIYLAEGESKFLKFVSDMVPVLGHRKVFFHDGRLKYPVHFISQEDPQFAGVSADQNPLRDLGFEPKRDALAWAVELDPKKSGNKITGFSVKVNEFAKKDGTTGSEPVVGPVFESGFAFWKALVEQAELSDIDDITEPVWVVKRVDRTTYQFSPRQNGQIEGLDAIAPSSLPNDESSIPEDFQNYIDLISSESYLKEKLPGLQPNAFAKTPTGAVATIAPVSSASTDDSDEPPFEPDTTEVSKPREGLAALRKKIASS